MEKISKYKIVGIVLGIIIFILVLILLLSDKSKKITCTMKSDQSQNGYLLEANYEIQASGDIVKTISITETITSSKSEVLDKFEKQLNEQYAYNNKTYGGYSYKVTKESEKVESRVTINYSKFDMKKFIQNNETMEKYTKDNHLTFAGAKKLYESTGATCK